MRKLVFILLLPWLAVTSTAAQADGQQPAPITSSKHATEEAPELEIRAAPPHGPFNLFIGEKITPKTPVTSSTRFEVLDWRVGYGFEGTYVWNRVRPLDQDDHREWWIKTGPFDDELVAGFPSIELFGVPDDMVATP